MTVSGIELRIMSLVCISVVICIGCDSGTGRCTVNGSVTLNGQSVDSGNIQFTPLGDNKASASGAPIVDGRYTIAREGGLLPGRYIVRIYWPEKNTMGQGRGVPLPKERIPTKYNINSELTAEVRAGGDNAFDFSL